MSLMNLLAPTYIQMLEALSRWLKKAETQLPMGEAEALLLSSLTPDMFPLATQVRFACVQAREGIHRLRREDFPPALTALLDEGRNARTQPGTLADAQRHIRETVEWVKQSASGSDGGAPERPLSHALPSGLIFDLTAEQYVRDWAIPQFYFHVMAAYAILRSSGIDLGKADYVQHMFAYARPEAMAPTA